MVITQKTFFILNCSYKLLSILQAILIINTFLFQKSGVCHLWHFQLLYRMKRSGFASMDDHLLPSSFIEEINLLIPYHEYTLYKHKSFFFQISMLFENIYIFFFGFFLPQLLSRRRCLFVCALSVFHNGQVPR